MTPPEKIRDNIKRVINDNLLPMDYELELFELWVKKFNPQTVSDLARKQNKSAAAISKKLKNNKLMHLEFGSQKLIICE